MEKRIRWRILKPSVDTTIYENLLVNCFINCAYYRVFIPEYLSLHFDSLARAR